MPRSSSDEQLEVSPTSAPGASEERPTSSFEELGAGPASGAKMQYRQTRAQTEKRSASQRAAGAQPREAAHAQGGKAAAPASAELPPAPALRQSAPIGALPLTEEPPAADAYATVWEEARRNMGLITHSLRDVSGAIGRLARLTADAMRRARQGMRPA